MYSNIPNFEECQWSRFIYTCIFLFLKVNDTESEKIKFQREAASSSSKLIDAKVLVCDLQEEIVRFR